MRTTLNRTFERRAAVYAVGLSAIWVVAAGLSPTTTYHLAPLLVAGILPLVYGFENAEANTRRLVTAAAAGGAVALIVTGFLALSDWLRGPSLLPFGGAVAESVVFALAGTAVGAVVGVARRGR